VHLLYPLEQALSLRGLLGEALLGPAQLPVATENQEYGNLYAENGGGSREGGGKVGDALVGSVLNLLCFRSPVRAWDYGETHVGGCRVPRGRICRGATSSRKR
jgi:hypothetical protein